jgi:hypothetical protein
MNGYPVNHVLQHATTRDIRTGIVSQKRTGLRIDSEWTDVCMRIEDETLA